MPKGNYDCTLKDQFEIKIGLIEDNYKKTTEAGEQVTFINLKASEDESSLYDGSNVPYWERSNLINYNKLETTNVKEQIKNKNEKTEVDKPYIPNERILTANDYVMSIRGRPKGFSLDRTLNKLDPTEKVNLIASHHFVYIRPIDFIIKMGMDVKYLHLLLDIILEIEILEKRLPLELKKKKNHNLLEQFKVNEFREIKISITTNVNDQKKIYNDFVSKYEQYCNANAALENYKMNLYKSLKNNDGE